MHTFPFQSLGLTITMLCELGKLRVWCVATGELVKVIDAHDEQIRGLCTTKDGQFIATGSWDNTIKLFQADSLKLVTTLAGHTDTVYSVVATSMYVKYV